MYNDEDLNVRNLTYTEEDSGIFFASTKKIFTWKFILDGISRTIILEHSRLTGKRKVFLDKKELVHFMKYTYSFSYSFSIDKHNISIQQIGYSYELRIENIPFRNLINKQKLARYNVIREEYIKEHPIIVEPPPKTEEEKKKEEEQKAMEFLKKRNGFNFQFNQNASIQEKNLIEEDSDEDNDEENKEQIENDKDEEEVDNDENEFDNIISNQGPEPNASERTEVDQNVNHFDLLGPEIFNSEDNNIITNKDPVNPVLFEQPKVPESIENINQNLNIEELKGIEFK